MFKLITKRNYAAEAGKLVLNFTLPHEALVKSAVVTQVNLSTTDGDMGILANHVPTIAQLNPGLVEIIGADKKTWFVSGGFAVMNPDSTLNINAIEAFPVADLDFEAAKKALEAAKSIATSGSGEAQIEAKIKVEVLEAVVASQKAL